MEWVTWKQDAGTFLRKYKFIFLVLLIGVFLMALPQGKQEEKNNALPEQVQPSLQQELAQILSHVAGAGRVEVLLTEAAGAETLYQTDDDTSSRDNTRDLRQDTVLVTNASRGETGLIRQILPPKYEGAVILCQGAEDARVRLAMVSAVMSVTGLSSDKISVLKMK